MNRKIFFVGNVGHGSTFIDNDYNELKKYFTVRYTPMKLYLHMHILQTFKNILWADSIFCWFASFRAVIPTLLGKILGKKIIVIAGGYDVVNAPEINYGAWTKIPDRWVSKFVFKHADLVLPVSKYIQNELLEKLPATNTKVIYNGVDTSKFYPQGGEYVNLVITVGDINWSNLKRKGIEDFVKTAKYLPNVKFVLIGKAIDDSIDYLKSIASKNVYFAGCANDEELLRWYQRAKVYAQLSYHEGFGVSVVEAMLCGCIPVITDKGALQEVTGHDAFLTSYNSPGISAAVIKEALKKKENYGERFAHRAVWNFSLKSRIKQLRWILG